MQFHRVRVFAVIFLCLLTAGVTQAQFGRLKSLAKEKLGVETKQDKAKTANESKTTDEDQDPLSADEGEAKASYAPGVQKSLEVYRKGRATPELTMSDLEGGRVQEVVIKVSNVDARLIDSVRGYKPCNKIEKFEIMSATEMKVMIDLSGQANDENCSLNFRSGGKYVAYASVAIQGADTLRRKREQDARMAEAQLPWEQQVALGKKRIGKVWTVNYDNGKTDKWTLIGPDPDNATAYRFKSATGDKFSISYSAGIAMIQMGDCMMQAPIQDKSAEGMAMQDCPVPLGTKFSANIQ